MVIGRSEDRNNPTGSMAHEAASLLATRSAEPIWASGLMTAPTGRTYDRKRPPHRLDPCKQGAVHIGPPLRSREGRRSVSVRKEVESKESVVIH